MKFEGDFEGIWGAINYEIPLVHSLVNILGLAVALYHNNNVDRHAMSYTQQTSRIVCTNRDHSDTLLQSGKL